MSSAWQAYPSRGIANAPSVSKTVRTIEMDSAVLCALACELILKVPSDGSASILDQMDVLDFPGARARAQVFDNTKLGSDPLALTEVFLRGKVAYLFDRYSDDRDITGLVLCQEGGPQEAKSLPYMINKWVEWSQGPDAKSRQNLTPLLFHVFTKFDVDLVRKKGEDPRAVGKAASKPISRNFLGGPEIGSRNGMTPRLSEIAFGSEIPMCSKQSSDATKPELNLSVTKLNWPKSKDNILEMNWSRTISKIPRKPGIERPLQDNPA